MKSKIKAIIDKELPLITNLSNVSSILREFGVLNWCGFYLFDEVKKTLFLGPFQGDVACTTIPFGKGVCGTCVKDKKTIIVDDVSKFDGHIACSSLSKSEMVAPIIVNGCVKAVIDLDSPILKRFSESDKDLIEDISKILEVLF